MAFDPININSQLFDSIAVAFDDLDYNNDQHGYAIADAAAGSWTVAPLWSKVDEVAADDSDSISSEVLAVSGSTSNADLTLTSLVDPVTAQGHIIRVRAKATFTLGTAATLNAELRQGAALIATLTTPTLTTGYLTYQYVLTAAEANAISDYTALFLRLYGTFAIGNLGGVQVSWLEIDFPYAPAAASIVNVSDADTFTGTDAGESIAAATTDTESGAGTDGGEAVGAGVADTETGAFADGGESTSSGTSDGDTGTGTDAGESIAAATTDADVFAGVDAGEAITAGLTDADLAAFLESEAIAAAVADAESGTGTDGGEGISQPTSDGDFGTFTDGGEVIVVIPFAGGGELALHQPILGWTLGPPELGWTFPDPLLGWTFGPPELGWDETDPVLGWTEGHPDISLA